MRFKKFFAVLLVAAMFLSMGTGVFPLLDRIPMVAYAAGDSDFVIEDGVLTEYNGSGGDVVIPDSVKEIGGGAFSGCKKLTSVMIPDSVEGIGWGTFSGCARLTSVTIPNSVTWIDNSVFSGCSSLKEILVSKGNKTFT
ncbi:MAG: leucine-rich repeat domain-containing protein, partial [Clostridia bacterium]|nr:leucine-rich repeat domain-containing protein [Clostridia bacterium]